MFLSLTYHSLLMLFYENEARPQYMRLLREGDKCHSECSPCLCHGKDNLGQRKMESEEAAETSWKKFRVKSSPRSFEALAKHSK